MNVAEAFEQLGLPETASVAEIEEKFKALANECHPDRGGSHDAMVIINSARDIALASRSESTALVPREVLDVVLREVGDRQRKLEGQERYIRLTKSVTDQLISPYEQRRLTAGVFAVIAAITAFFATQISADTLDALAFGTPIGVIAAVSALFALVSHHDVKRYKGLMDALAGELEQRDIVANLLIESRVGDEFTEDDLVGSIENPAPGRDEAWLSDRQKSIGKTISKIGARDAARLIIARASSHGLIEGRSKVEFGSYKSIFVTRFPAEETEGD